MIFHKKQSKVLTSYKLQGNDQLMFGKLLLVVEPFSAEEEIHFLKLRNGGERE